MLDEANQAAHDITLGAFNYADDIMEKIEKQLQIYYDVVSPWPTKYIFSTWEYCSKACKPPNTVSCGAWSPPMASNGGRLLVDAGANTNVDVENLVQFAQMGSIYMNSVMGIAAPKVGLINNGSEETKGSELTQAMQYFCY